MPETIARINQSLALTSDDRNTLRFTNSEGCAQCDFTGNVGRRVVAEMLAVDDHILSALAKEDSLELYTAWANSYGSDKALGKTLREKAQELMANGLLCPIEFESKFGFIE
ncbi:hypothetical protein F2Z80_03985 [Vibrio fortis]|uniref:Uncharacterized protein n=1 Tax=Vibrio fortis TaxID=212667 RepID=A0A5N3S925_9VIBR|nr:hypothetical protein [Vibrio fortis]KAB0303169.1 hypothetical protein F2Z80_03985 [Vibrio fortis]